MKIGYLVHNIDPKNGGGRFASNIIEGVRAYGHDVVILKELDDGLEGCVVLGRGLKIVTSLLRVHTFLKDCDIIHTIDGYPYGIIAWLVNISLKKKLIIGALGTYAVAPLYKRSTSIFLKLAYKSAYKIIASSNFTKQEILKKVSLDNIFVITPGIHSLQRGDNYIKPNNKFILGVGGLKARKGYHISLAAFAKVSKDFPDYQYVIIGDENWAYQELLHSIIKKNGLENSVQILHKVSEEYLQELYTTATLFILTPINTAQHHFEGFGLVYLEAASAGLPVIGTFGNGAQEAIQNGRNGILVPQNNVEETAEAIFSILSDPQKQKLMSKESLKWLQLNTIENEITKILEIYK